MRSGFLGGGWIGPSAFGGGGIGIPADPVPEAGAELLTNGNFAAGSSGWSASAAWSFSGGTATRTAAAANNLAQAKTLAAGTWYLLAFDLVAVSAGTIAVSPGLAVNGIAKSTPQSSLDIVRPLTISANYFYFLPSDSFAGTVDNASLKNLTLSSLLSTRPYASPDCDISAAVTRTEGTQAGLCARLDDPATPANFIICYLDGAGNVKVDKCVGGTYTNVISGAVTYAAGRILRLVCWGNNVSVYYNGTQVGSTTAVADAGIVSNTNHGLFSTYAANTFTNYVNTKADWASAATWQVVTTGAATLTIAELTVSAATTVDWGDGSTDAYTGSGARTHNYAGAGTFLVSIHQSQNVTALTLSDNKIVLTSAGIAPCVNMTVFTATGVKSGTFNSADVSAWRPTNFYLYSMPAGYAGTFDSADVSAWRPANFLLHSMPAGYAGTLNSADVSAWRPVYFRLYSMPAGYAGTFNSADVSAWRPADFRLYSMPAGYAGTFNSADVSAWRPANFYLHSMPAGYAGTLNSADVSAWRPVDFRLHSMPAGYAITAGGGFVGWTTTTIFQMQGSALPQATVDAILLELYQASIAPRTGVNGTINVGGSNAAPSGTFQACASPPVSVATPGKEIAYELLNDSLGLFNNWATVTITA